MWHAASFIPQTRADQLSGMCRRSWGVNYSGPTCKWNLLQQLSADKTTQWWCNAMAVRPRWSGNRTLIRRERRSVRKSTLCGTVTRAGIPTMMLGRMQSAVALNPVSEP